MLNYRNLHKIKTEWNTVIFYKHLWIHRVEYVCVCVCIGVSVGNLAQINRRTNCSLCDLQEKWYLLNKYRHIREVMNIRAREQKKTQQIYVKYSACNWQTITKTYSVQTCTATKRSCKIVRMNVRTNERAKIKIHMNCKYSNMNSRWIQLSTSILHWCLSCCVDDIRHSANGFYFHNFRPSNTKILPAFTVAVWFLKKKLFRSTRWIFIAYSILCSTR